MMRQRTIVHNLKCPKHPRYDPYKKKQSVDADCSFCGRLTHMREHADAIQQLAESFKADLREWQKQKAAVHA